MRRSHCSFFLLLIAGLSTLLPPRASAADAGEPLRRIAFGSCAKQDKPQPIWEAILAARPEAFVFLGDNIYGDSDDVEVLRAKYAQLAAVPGFGALRGACRVLATWDDHDYGKNDAGADFPLREASQKLFLDFWKEPAGSPRRTRPGVYTSYHFGPAGRRVQVILLDTRYFRGPLKGNPEPVKHPGPYGPNRDPAAALLGEAQWKWLEAELKAPAELRLVCSSIQVVPAEHGWEKWDNFPLERERLFKLVRDTKAGGVVFVSGDRHFAEISRLDDAAAYPLYDLTTSSLNAPGKRGRVEPNAKRVGALYEGANFGLVTVDWSKPDPEVKLQVLDGKGKPVIEQAAGLGALKAGAKE